MKRNKFSLSHYKLLTADMGYLIPITWFEVIPGDTIQQATAILLRVSPLLAPVMHPVRVRVHHWYVPNRLVWDDWEDFITGGPDGNDATVYPSFAISASPTESGLMDYLGVPPGTTYGAANLRVSALPCRAYNLIYNDHYRDQDLVTELTIEKGNGHDATTTRSLQKVAWEKDYFTTSRPWEQKGTQVTIPIGEDAPVYGIGKEDQSWSSGSQGVYETQGGDTYTKYRQINPGAATTNVYIEGKADNNPNIYADLSAATGVSVNDLRLSLAIQRYQEARARYGSRYSEYLRYLGIRSSDARLQNPEYLGGGKQVIQFSEVLSTDGANTGDMKGHGISAMRSNRYRRFFEEHGIVMSLLSVVPKAMYTQGCERKFYRQTKEDYFQRELQHLGEQEVLNRELYTDATDREDIFGYQSRYDEYRSQPSSIAGEFRSTLDHWHMARIFASEPALNQTFTDATPTKRILASAGTDGLYIMANHSIQARRMLTKFSKPKTF